MKKKIIILITIILSGISFTQAQSAGDIDTLSTWRVDRSEGYITAFKYWHYRYYINGTSTVNSKEYYKVYRSGYSYESSGGIHYNYNYFNGLAGHLREDNDKWYTLNGGNYEVLLYDFTLEVGDTVITYANSFGIIITVGSIDTILVDGENKKRFHLESAEWCADYIIEDIGATSGLWEELWYFEWSSFLVCYAIDGMSVWGYSTAECDLLVSIDDIDNQTFLTTYPNPFTTSTTIEFTLNGKSKIQMTIYNSIGETVYQFEDHMKQGIHTVTWSPGHLPEGMYYAVLRSEEGVSVVKMVKQ